MAVLVDRAVSLYQEFSRLPSVTSGSIYCSIGSCSAQGRKSYTVTSCWSQRDLQKMENVQSLRQHQVITDNHGTPVEASCVGFPTERKGELLRRCSPSGKLVAIIRKITNKKGDEKQYIEVWNCQKMLMTIDVAAADEHGKIYEDEQFGCIEWSTSEKKLLYVAEKKQPKTSSYFESKSTCKEDGEDVKEKGNEFVYREDWGEQLVSKHMPSLCVLDIDSASIAPLEGVPDDISPGQALWAPNDEDVIFVGWKNSSFRLGLRFCPMRSCDLYLLRIKDRTFDVLSEPEHAVSNPRFNWDMSKLVYLRNKTGGPHMQCSQLLMYDWKTKETKVVVEIQDRPGKTEFPGLYLVSLPRKCWSSDNKRIYTHSAWRSCREIIEINVETQTVKKITSFGSDGDEWMKFGAWSVLDVKDDLVLAVCGSPNIPHRLVIGKIGSGNDAILWKYLDENHVEFSNFQFEIKAYSPKTPDNFEFEAILLTPKGNTEQSKPPLIAFPHGGPHSVFVADYMLYPAVFCHLGFAVLMINYRGSIGFGNEFIMSLLGNVGCNDVQDCKQAIDQTIADGVADGNKVVLQGGSHGGFLVCHLIGQFPNAFKACVARNPVTNMASKLGATDIPDWNYTESGLGDYYHSRLPSAEVYGTMFQKSPLSHVDKVKTPTMIMIGTADKRVPPQQGYEFARALQARGIKTRVLSYQDDNHSLAKTNVEADAFINMFKWFIDHL
ncbi:acylamino-acid-releasing enzyme-like [Anneissia japonica]|uniref:acylamino-acid-releasing enzyme-like n=1 Tax=Anneissia japonica TaxID=1529436 RepID=UPI001425AE5E|nr:acylamino-acid-releasing enzyme-like [Anneissia japonica]